MSARTKAIQQAKSVLSAGGEVLGKIATRLGLASATSPQKIWEYAKNNPLATAIVLYEMYGAGNEALQELLEEHPELKEPIRLFSYSPDPVEVDSDIMAAEAEMADELQLISDGIGVVRSFENLLILKHVLSLDDSHFARYLAVREQGRRLR